MIVNHTIDLMKTTAIGDNTSSGFRAILQCELARRCAANAQYSLRAFAKSIRINHSSLSQIMRGKRRLTHETIRALANELGIAKADVEAFVAHQQRVGDDDGWDRHVRQLQEEAMEVIAQWHHFAILELIRLESFRPDCRWIARVLDITVDEVNMALTRLLHLGLLEMVDQKTWLDLSENAYAQFDQLPAAVAQQLMTRINRLAKSGENEQVLSSSTIAIDRKRLSVVSSYLEKARRDIAELLRSDGSPCDDVYQLDILLYPLTTLHQENNDGSTSDAVSDHRQEPGQGR
jgi:transcriptional regulator with XRE-family HTH domain